MKLSFLNWLPSYKAVTRAAPLLAPMVDTQRLPYPFLVTLVVTRRCNSRCRMCNIWQDKDSPQLSLEQIQHIFGRDDFSFVRQLVLTGGEPTLRSDLPDLLEVVRAACPNLEHVELAVNGLNPRRTLEYVQRMLGSIEHSPGRINRFVAQVSLDGIGDTHDDIRGVRGAYRAVCETLDSLGQLEKRYPILSRRLSCVVMPQNLAHVEPLRAFARERGCSIFFSPAVLSGEYFRNLNGGNDLTFISGGGRNEEAARVFAKLGAYVNKRAMRFYYEDVSRMLQGAERSRQCMMGFYGFVIEHDGSVYPCVNFESNSFGNLLEQSFDEVWFGPQAKVARQELRHSACSTCVANCYVLPANAGEAIKLVASRIKRE